MARRYHRDQDVDEEGDNDAVFSDGENYDVLPLPSPGMDDPDSPLALKLPGKILQG